MAFDPERTYDYSDLLATPDDGKRYELIEGRFYVNPSPTPIHQRVSRRLQRQLEDYFHDCELGEVFNAPIDLILTNSDVFVPDLVVVADPAHITGRGIEGPPLLVVEVLSPSTQKVDRTLKAQRYAELGARHYWIVDPAGHRIECFRAAGSDFEPVIEVQGATTLDVADWDGLVIDVAALWR